MFKVVDQKYTTIECPGNLKAPIVQIGYEKDNINFEWLEFRPKFFVPIKSCCGEASLIGDLPK